MTKSGTPSTMWAVTTLTSKTIGQVDSIYFYLFHNCIYIFWGWDFQHVMPCCSNYLCSKDILILFLSCSESIIQKFTETKRDLKDYIEI